MTTQYIFDSLSALNNSLEREPVNIDASCGASGKTFRGDAWTLGVELDGAREIMRRGGHWPEGAEKLTAATVEASAMRNTKPAALAEMNVTGHTLDVGAYLAGDPCCFEFDGDEEHESKPIVSIGVNCSVSSDVTAAMVTNRGAAVLSYVDALENAGYRVEVFALWACHGGIDVDIRTMVKAADSHWSPSTVAFALCHPAYLRRAMFRLAECEPNLRGICNGGSMGYVGDKHLYNADGSIDGLDVYFTGIRGREDRRFQTLRGSLEHVEQAVGQFLSGDGANYRDAA